VEAASVACFVVDKVPELVEGAFSGEHAIRVHAETTASAAFKNLDFMIYLLFKNSTLLVMSAQADISLYIFNIIYSLYNSNCLFTMVCYAF
jgi:hypothetical protein